MTPNMTASPKAIIQVIICILDFDDVLINPNSYSSSLTCVYTKLCQKKLQHKLNDTLVWLTVLFLDVDYVLDHSKIVLFLPWLKPQNFIEICSQSFALSCSLTDEHKNISCINSLMQLINNLEKIIACVKKVLQYTR